MITGCAGSHSAHKTLGVIGYTVDTAMEVVSDARARGELSLDDWQKVSYHHERYRLVYETAVTAARFDLDKYAPSDVSRLSGELTTLITELTTKDKQ